MCIYLSIYLSVYLSIYVEYRGPAGGLVAGQEPEEGCQGLRQSCPGRQNGGPGRICHQVGRFWVGSLVGCLFAWLLSCLVG